MRRRASRQSITSSPHELWNAYVDLLAMSEYEDLSADQRPAHLVFWYDAEVNNGGHLQYFENKGTIRLDETIDSLGKLGAYKHQEVLTKAQKLLLSKKRKPIETVEAFVGRALGGEYDELNNAFYEIKPDLIELLERHLDANTELFVEIVEDK